MIRQELLRTKAELERELERLELDCSSCGRRVHWVSGLVTVNSVEVGEVVERA